MTRAAELEAMLIAAQAEMQRCREWLAYSEEASFTADAAGLIWLSPACARQFGYTLATAQALAVPLLAQLPARLARYAGGDATRWQVRRELELPHADGHPVSVEITTTLLPETDGSVRRIHGIVRDLTLARELALQQKQFTSMLSHEFRTPLAVIDGAAQLLEMTGTAHDESTRKRYRKIQTAADRLLALLDEHLTPERMAEIGRVRQPDQVAPASLLQTAVQQAASRRSNITLALGNLPAQIRCDPAGMRLCLDVVLDNAIKYTPATSVIEVSGQMAAGGGLEMLVRDHGDGVAESELGRIFEKAYRGNNAGQIAGSGLGLYMASAVLEVHGGSLTARHASGGGMEFRIWLPIASQTGKVLA
ncbi:ATP-binding protein [Pseudoduganella danionis]|uniref:PAS domain-containing sensor histidine kinase n=1 Tax=Pseudoduganella danionis TaxID=1890295 RepID=UPI0035B2B788